jgi:hypothetical protein
MFLRGFSAGLVRRLNRIPEQIEVFSTAASGGFTPKQSQAIFTLVGRSRRDSRAFGELSHGARGLRDDLASMIGMDDDRVLPGFVRLLAIE